MPSRRPPLPASIPPAPDLLTNVAAASIRDDVPAVPVRAAPLPYPPISSIPRTSPSRLAAATPPANSPIPDSPTASFPDPSSSSAGTVLYLAYGSNMAASVFLGVRGIRPLSQINVSAPSLRLTFDLPAMPYREPCFANTAVRELPKLPPIPPAPPGVEPPELPSKSTHPTTLQPPLGRNSHGDPVWTKGLIGVVYEVTREDYAKIVATEGGGSSYQDVLVPCIELPQPVVRIPEKPRFPDPPSRAPFLAHTLLAPPAVPDGDDNDNADGGTKQEDDNDGKPRLPWYARFLAPRRRPDPDYAQPSERYLNLLRDGAREHDLPAEYQDWLAALAPYKVTSTRQKIGAILLYLIMGPFLIIIFSLGPLLADENGRMPLWLSVALGMLFRITWWLYDVFLKKVFGDGERTEEDGDDQLGDRPHGGMHQLRKRLGSVSEPALDEEKKGLLEEEEE